MRELKFRIWDNEYKIMEYDGYHLDFNGKALDISVYYDGLDTKEIDCVVMEFTGLKDKNGKSIYEGDIIRWHDVVTSDYPVTFTDGVFCLDESAESNFYHHREEISTKWEVIGNIYENSELLK